MVSSRAWPLGRSQSVCKCGLPVWFVTQSHSVAPCCPGTHFCGLGWLLPCNSVPALCLQAAGITGMRRTLNKPLHENLGSQCTDRLSGAQNVSSLNPLQNSVSLPLQSPLNWLTLPLPSDPSAIVLLSQWARVG